MNTLLSRFGLAATCVAIMAVAWVAPAMASVEPPPVKVPEPGTLALLSAGAAALTLGARWFRRK